MQPYVEDTLDTIEGLGLLASFMTLYGGTLLYSPRLDDSSFKYGVTIGIVGINLFFALFLVYCLVLALQRGADETTFAAREGGALGLLSSTATSWRRALEGALGSSRRGGDSHGIQRLEMAIRPINKTEESALYVGENPILKKRDSKGGRSRQTSEFSGSNPMWSNGKRPAVQSSKRKPG